MAPGSIGPYSVEEVLGQGGMGVVYRAVHRQTGARVALKTVTVDSRARIDSIRREARALARLRHPGVVRVVDEGVQDGRPWYAMELVEGRALGHAGPEGCSRVAPAGREGGTRATGTWMGGGATTELGEVPLEGRHGLGWPLPVEAKRTFAPRALTGVVRAFAQLAQTLAYVHGEGVIHRDLKPGNVLQRADGSVVLVDFGLVAAFPSGVGREVLEFAAQAGTFAYMAPEQLDGSLVDARADLYALGCMLYEAVTGVPPFGGSAQEVVSGHLSRAPRPPSWLVEGLPESLEALCLELLAKDPEQRIAHGSVVVGRLTEVAGQALVPPDWPEPRPYLFRGPLVGRLGETAKLEALVDRAASGTTAVGWISGASGVGKTRLALDAGSRAARSGFRVLSGQCDVISSEPLHALLPILQALVDDCRVQGEDECERVFGPRGPWLWPLVAGVADLPGQSVRSPPAPARDNRAQLVDAVASVLGAAAGLAPLALLIDDLQWADPLTLEVVERLVAAPPAVPMLLIGTWRVDQVTQPLAALSPRGHLSLELGGLDERDVSKLVCELLAQNELPDWLVADISSRSEGNPFFVAELLRGAVHEAVLERDRVGRWQARPGVDIAMSIPGTVREVVQRRLRDLPAAAASVARMASVAGREAPFSLLASVCDLDERGFLDAVGELVARQVFAEADGLLRFTHAQLRDGAYEGIAADDRAGRHRRVADALEALPGLAQQHATIARHRELSGQHLEAGLQHELAADVALARFDLVEAERRLRDAIALLPPTEASLDARFKLSYRVFYQVGRLDESEQVAQEEADLARSLGAYRVESRALRTVAAVHLERGQVERALRQLEEARVLARKVGDDRGQAFSLLNMAIACHTGGRIEQAIQYLERCHRVVLRVGATDLENSVLGALAICKMEQGEWVRAADVYQQAIALTREQGLRDMEGQHLNNLGNLLFALGRIDEARAAYERSLFLIRESQAYMSVARAECNLAVFLAHVGEWQEATSYVASAVDRCARIGDPPSLADYRAYQAVILGEQGRHEEAVRLAAEACALFEELGHDVRLGAALIRWALVLRGAGDWDEAETQLQRAARLLEQHSDPSVQGELWIEQAWLALHRGRPSSALALLERLEALIQRLGCSPDSPLARGGAAVREAMALAGGVALG